MHGAYIFTETILHIDRKVGEHAAKVGSEGHFARFSYPHQPSLLYSRTISGLSWVDFLGTRAGDCLCSCVFPWSEKGSRSLERSAASLLPGACYQGRSVGGRYRLCASLPTQRV